MREQNDLEQRVRSLEAELAQFKQQRFRGVRYRSSLSLGGVPLIAIALGPDFERGEFRGHAKGIIAIGDFATGVFALGGLARGVFSIGGLSLGVVSLGGLSLGALVAVGGLAIGSLAIGGGAVGGLAVGGGAAGYYACGGAAVGKHPVDPRFQDPEALAFFRDLGAEDLCRGKPYRPAPSR